MLKTYEYVGQHHTMVVLEKGQPKVRVEPNETVETELSLPKNLFKEVVKQPKEEKPKTPKPPKQPKEEK